MGSGGCRLCCLLSCDNGCYDLCLRPVHAGLVHPVLNRSVEEHGSMWRCWFIDRLDKQLMIIIPMSLPRCGERIDEWRLCVHDRSILVINSTIENFFRIWILEP